MYKLILSIKKECLLLVKDMGALILLFLMPLILIITVTSVQSSSFDKANDAKIDVLLVNLDNGNVSKIVNENLAKGNNFNVVREIDHKPLTEQEAKGLVFKGKYKLAIVIPPNLSKNLNTKVNGNVSKILEQLGVKNKEAEPTTTQITDSGDVKLYFDPALQETFKSAVRNSFQKIVSEIESKTIYQTFQNQLDINDNTTDFRQENIISFKEILPQTTGHKNIHPNAVQHNVAAWSLFAIFFIIIPLSINIVKEKNQGTFVRLRTTPVGYATVIGGKTIAYLIICLLQFWAMVLVGVYLFPLIGLSKLQMGNTFVLASIVALFSGFAAVGLGVLIGTIAKTQEQSAPFGATFTMILAAIGGIWIPVFAMPQLMQYVAHLSPMNWGINAFYDVFLRQGNFWDILPNIGLLFFLFVITILAAIFYENKKYN